MSGRISVDDRALDGSAKRLRSAKAGLAGVGSQLNDGLASGAPPAVAGPVRAAIADARRSITAVQSQLEWRANELTRRAAWARIASGDMQTRDVAIMLGWGASKVSVKPEFKDIAGGFDETFARWADHWKTHYLRRNPGVKAAGISKLRAWLAGRTHWVQRRAPILKHAKTVKWLRRGSRTIRVVSIALDGLDIVTAKGTVKQNEAVGKTVGGLAGAWGGAQAGAAIGAFGGPIGIAVGAGVGAMIGATVGSSLGKHAGRWIGQTSVGKTIGKGIDGAKKAISGAGKLLKKVKLW